MKVRTKDRLKPCLEAFSNWKLKAENDQKRFLGWNNQWSFLGLGKNNRTCKNHEPFFVALQTTLNGTPIY